MPRTAPACSLKLADGFVWTFFAPSESGLDSWLDEFAQILTLEKTERAGETGPGARGKRDSAGGRPETSASRLDGRGRIHILPFQDKSRIPEGLDASWTAYSQGSAYRAWISSNAAEAVLEINPEFLNHPEIRYIDMSAALKIVFRHCLASGSGCPLHAASAELDGSAVIITASGHTGKSTCHDRFPAPWRPLADDTALAVRNSAGGFSVHPMPTWSDYLQKKRKSTFETGRAYPLKGLFFLEQAPVDEVKPVSAAVSAGILHRLSREAWASFFSRLGREEKKRLDGALFDISCAIARATPGRQLRATLDGKFWIEIEKTL